MKIIISFEGFPDALPSFSFDTSAVAAPAPAPEVDTTAPAKRSRKTASAPAPAPEPSAPVPPTPPVPAPEPEPAQEELVENWTDEAPVDDAALIAAANRAVAAMDGSGPAKIRNFIAGRYQDDTGAPATLRKTRQSQRLALLMDLAALAKGELVL